MTELQWKLVDSRESGGDSSTIIVSAVVDTRRCKFGQTPQYSVSARANSENAQPKVLHAFAPFIALANTSRHSFTIVLQLPAGSLPFTPISFSNTQVAGLLKDWVISWLGGSGAGSGQTVPGNTYWVKDYSDRSGRRVFVDVHVDSSEGPKSPLKLRHANTAKIAAAVDSHDQQRYFVSIQANGMKQQWHAADGGSASSPSSLPVHAPSHGTFRVYITVPDQVGLLSAPEKQAGALGWSVTWIRTASDNSGTFMGGWSKAGHGSLFSTRVSTAVGVNPITPLGSQIFVAQFMVSSLDYESVPVPAVKTAACTEAEADLGACTGTGGFKVYVKTSSNQNKQPSAQWVVAYVGFGACYQVSLLVHEGTSTESSSINALLGDYAAVAPTSRSKGGMRAKRVAYKQLKAKGGHKPNFMYYANGLWVVGGELGSSKYKLGVRSRVTAPEFSEGTWSSFFDDVAPVYGMDAVCSQHHPMRSIKNQEVRKGQKVEKRREEQAAKEKMVATEAEAKALRAKRLRTPIIPPTAAAPADAATGIECSVDLGWTDKAVKDRGTGLRTRTHELEVGVGMAKALAVAVGVPMGHVQLVRIAPRLRKHTTKVHSQSKAAKTYAKLESERTLVAGHFKRVSTSEVVPAAPYLLGGGTKLSVGSPLECKALCMTQPFDSCHYGTFVSTSGDIESGDDDQAAHAPASKAMKKVQGQCWLSASRVASSKKCGAPCVSFVRTKQSKSDIANAAAKAAKAKATVANEDVALIGLRLFMRVALPHNQATSAKQALMSTAFLMSKPVFITLLSGQPQATSVLQGGASKILSLQLSKVCVAGLEKSCVAIGPHAGPHGVGSIGELMAKWSTSAHAHEMKSTPKANKAAATTSQTQLGASFVAAITVQLHKHHRMALALVLLVVIVGPFVIICFSILCRSKKRRKKSKLKKNSTRRKQGGGEGQEGTMLSPFDTPDVGAPAAPVADNLACYGSVRADLRPDLAMSSPSPFEGAKRVVSPGSVSGISMPSLHGGTYQAGDQQNPQYPPGQAIRMKVGIMEPVNMGKKRWETKGSSDFGGATF
jgi:hypothetical protein